MASTTGELTTGPFGMREPVLDTVERVSEMCFGLFMALTFVGAVSAATVVSPQARALVSGHGDDVAAEKLGGKISGGGPSAWPA